MHPNDNLLPFFEGTEGPQPKYIIYYDFQDHTNATTPSISSHRLTELVYVTGGCGKLYVEDQEYNLNPGDFYVVNPNIMHGECLRHSDFHTSMQFYVIGCESLFFSNEKMGFQSPINVLKTRIPFLVKEIYNETKENDLNRTEAVRLLFGLLFLDVRTAYKTSTEKPKYNTLNQLVNSAQKYIDLHFNEKITLQGLSEVLFCNESTLSHSFRKHLNCSIIEYVMKNRLECAKMWLTISNRSIMDIAMISGFSSVSYFCEYFKKNLKQSPLQYRKNNYQKAVKRDDDLFNDKKN